ncbi:MAG: sensory transduction histidine kinase [Chthoniobacteraceae bacterium]|nr:sensory transduction histidine kinase [Chthoniobacteraceae bacterium]
MSLNIEPYPTRRIKIIQIALLGFLYYGAAWIGLRFSFEKSNVSPVWPAAGFALAGMLSLGWRAWPAIFLGAFAANATNLLSGPALPFWTVSWVSAVIAFGNTVEALFGWFLYRRYSQKIREEAAPDLFVEGINVFEFAALALLMCLSGAFIGVTTVCAAGLAPWIQYRLLWRLWWFGDASGVLLVTPFVLAWAQAPRIEGAKCVWREPALTFLLLALSCWWGFGRSREMQSFPYLTIIVPMVWISTHLGLRAVTGGLIFVWVYAVWQTVRHAGLFVGIPEHALLLRLLLFLWVASLTSLALAGTVEALKKSEANLQKLNKQLENRATKHTAELQSSHEALQAESFDRAEAEKTRAHLAAIVEFSLDAIFSKTVDAVVTSWNRGAEQLYGYTAAEMVGKSVSLLIPPDYKDELARMMASIRQGEPIKHYDTKRVRKDGHRIDVSLSISPIYDQSGQLIGSSTIARDIAERIRVEEALKESQERLKLALDAAQLGTWDLDLVTHNVIHSLRHDQIFGYAEALPEWSYERFLTCVHPEDRTRVDSEFQESVAAGRDWAFECRIFRADHSPGWIWACGILLKNKMGKPARMVGIVADITERKEGEQKLKEALKKEVILRREIHHRVKNNLQVITSLLYLQSVHLSDPRIVQLLRESQSRIRSIALIHELLCRSKDLAKIPVAEYVRNLTMDLSVAYRVNPDVISFKIHAEGIFLSLDPAIPCGLIVNELVSNSLKHAFVDGRAGWVAIDLQPVDSGLLRLSVRDNGLGLAPGFDLENVRTMGLRLVRDLVRQLNGTLALSYVHGTQITITFANSDTLDFTPRR